MRENIRYITHCSLFATLLCIGAAIRVPMPAVTVTMQVLFVILSGMILGKNKAFLSVLLYVGLGLLGVPVFASGGGIQYVLHPTFGYIIGFLVASYVVGFICESKSDTKGFVLSGFSGLGIIHLCGIIYYYLITRFIVGQEISLEYIFYYCFLTTIPGDVFSVIVAIILSRQLRRADVCNFY